MANQTLTVKVHPTIRNQIFDSQITLAPGDSLKVSVVGVIKWRTGFRQQYTYAEGIYRDGAKQDKQNLAATQDYDDLDDGPNEYLYPEIRPFSLGIFIGEGNGQDIGAERLQGARSITITPDQHNGGTVYLAYNKKRSYKDSRADGAFEVTIQKLQAEPTQNLPNHTTSPIRFTPYILQQKKEKTHFASAFFWFIQPRYGPAEAYVNWDLSLDCPAYQGEFGLPGNVTPAMKYKKNRNVDLSSVPQSVKNEIKAPDVKAVRLDWGKVVSGYYQGAYIEVFEADPEGDRRQRTLWVVGEMGESNLEDHQATIEISPMTEWINREIGQRIQPICDVGRLPGETPLRGRCTNQVKFDGPKIEDWTRGGTVASLNSLFQLTFSPSVVGAWPAFEQDFPGNFGRIRGATGVNKGVVRDVGTFDAATGLTTLRRALPLRPEIGDKFEIEAGCDGTFDCCKNTWNNLKNARFFVYVPGRGALLRKYQAG